jgi:membrane protein
MKKITLKGLWTVLKNSFKGFGDDKVMKLSASLAYYTVFSMGPLLIVIISLCGFFLGREAIEGQIYRQMDSFVGHDAALQIQQIIRNASISDQGTVAAIIGVVTLLVGATTVFAEIQDSINMIWGLKPKPRKGGIWLLVKSRLLSFGIIVSLGFLLLVSLGVTAVIEGLGGRLKAVFPDVGVVVLYVANLVITFVVITILFSAIFKVLPDARIRWRDVIAGAIATALLFMLGRFAISFYIGQSNVGTTYGTAGSLVVLLLWIYYSSVILYFGAEFTKAYAVEFGRQILPAPYAVTTTMVEVEGGKESIQQKENKKQQMQDGNHVEAPTLSRHEKPAPKPAAQAVSTPPNPPSTVKTSTVPAKKGNKKPGMLTLLGGLLLYFITSKDDKQAAH